MDASLLAILIILALPVTLGLVVLVAYLLMLRWKKLADQASEESATSLGDSVRRLDGMRHTAAVYGEADCEPYTGLVGKLNGRVGELETSTAKIVQGWQSLGDSPAIDALNPAQMFSNGIRDANRRFRAAQIVRRQAAENRGRIVELQKLVAEMDAIPEQTAKRVATAGEQLSEIRERIERLHVMGVQGEEFAAARRSVEQAEALFRAIPVLAASPETAVSEGGTPGEGMETVAPPAGRKPDPTGSSGPSLDVLRAVGGGVSVLAELEPLLGLWVPRLREWDEQASLADETVVRLAGGLADLRAALEQVPPGLDAGQWHETALRLSRAVDDLQVRRKTADGGQLRTLQRESGLLEKTVQESRAELDRAGELVTALAGKIRRMKNDLESISDRMNEAELQPVRPLRWENGQVQMTLLEKEFEDLGNPEERRTVAVAGQRLETAEGLSAKIAAFSRAVDQAIAQHGEIISQLGSPHLLNSGTWVRETSQLAAETSIWSADNWAKADGISSLVEDIARVRKLQETLVDGENSQPVRESEVAEVLAGLRRLAGMHTEEHARTERVRQRLEQLSSQEQDARIALDMLDTHAGQAELQVRGNRVLGSAPAQATQKLHEDTAALRAELDQRAEGSLERKLEKVHGLESGYCATVNGWLETLGKDLTDNLQRMQAQLKSLAVHANLDDRAVTEAQGLLAQLGAEPVYKVKGGPEGAGVELKRCVLDAQAAASYANALDVYARPVHETFREFNEEYHKTRSLYHPAAGLTGGRSEWPPTRQLMEEEIAEFREIEKQVGELHTQTWSYSRLARDLGAIQTALGRLSIRAAEGVRQAEQERAAAQVSEREVLDLQRSWLQISRKLEGNLPQISLAAKELTVKADQRLSAYRRQYRGGTLDYDQVIEGLHDLADTLRWATFPNGEDEEITIHS